MKHFEYLEVIIGEWPAVTPKLNELGQEGWEAVTYIKVKRKPGPSHFYFILKREIK